MHAAARNPWLAVIDAQNVFTDAGSPWYLPSFAPTATGIAGLVRRFGPRAVFPRFIPPREIGGGWGGSHRQWECPPGPPAPTPRALADPRAGPPRRDRTQISQQ